MNPLHRRRYVQGKDSEFADAVDAECTDPHSSGCEVLSKPLGGPLLRGSWIDSDYTNNSAFPKVGLSHVFEK